MQTYDIIIVGGGPAGLTAAIYARRNGKSVLLLEKEGFGGQIAYAPRVENYPGVGAVSGAELAERMLEQAMDLDTDTDIGTVCEIVDRGGPQDRRQIAGTAAWAFPTKRSSWGTECPTARCATADSTAEGPWPSPEAATAPFRKRCCSRTSAKRST